MQLLPGIAALLIAAVVTGCSAEDPGHAASAPSRSTTQSPAVSASPTVSNIASSLRSPGAASSCLFSVARVSRVLAGSWQRHPRSGHACVYSSDRGGVFTTSIVDQAIKPGLRDARAACVAHVRPIAVARGRFVCLEQHGSDDVIVGNAGVHGRLWLLAILSKAGGTHRAELAAMTALMGAIPK